jgi:glutathione synthase/RimK-type ligase-like ATP-grasp enzyme
MPSLIYGVYREKALSPGKVAEDAAILEAVLRRLAARGREVRRLAAEDLGPKPPAAAGVLHMAQGPQALGLLAQWEGQGLSLVNSPEAVRRCYRRHLFPLLAGEGVPCPRTRFFPLAEALERWGREFPGPGWLKRAEVHAEGPGDVARVADLEDALPLLADFARRDLRALVWQEHVPGEEIKFYAVGPGRLLKAFWPATGAPVTGSLIGEMAALASRLAALSGLEVFGGDVILTPEGEPVLIDLNDWPSFSRCREAAAREIAHYAEEKWRL